MALVHVNWNPADRQLRQFGLIALVALPLIGWLWGASSAVIGGLAAAGVVLAMLGVLCPRAVKPVFLALTILTIPIGLIVGELVMLILYFGVFLPIGLVFRLIGRDALERKFDRKAATYWQPKKQAQGPASYFRQS